MTFLDCPSKCGFSIEADASEKQVAYWMTLHLKGCKGAPVKPSRAAEIANAREVDGRIAAEWTKYWALVNSTKPLHNGVGDFEKSIARLEQTEVGKWGMTAERIADDIKHYEERIAQTEAKIAAIMAEAKPFADAATKIEKNEYKGWSRFFLVQHIHRSQHCSSFRMNTQIGWLPELSGQTEAEAVKEHGAILCTICFPSAPVEWTRGLSDEEKGYCSGTTYSERRGMGGICADCGKWVAFKSWSNGSPRKHKKEAK